MSWKRTATPVHEFELPVIYEEFVDKLILTYSQNDKPVIELTEKDIGDSITVYGNILTVSMTQEQSAKFNPGEVIAEIKLWTNDRKSLISEDVLMYVKQVRNERMFE